MAFESLGRSCWDGEATLRSQGRVAGTDLEPAGASRWTARRWYAGWAEGDALLDPLVATIRPAPGTGTGTGTGICACVCVCVCVWA